MSLDSCNLSSLARTKLSLSTTKDVSLHRWVLLKNSILHSPSLPNNPARPEVNHSAYRIVDEDEEDSDADVDVIQISGGAFMFPDAGHFVSSSAESSFCSDDDDARTSEAQWLDSLLETLGEDEDEDDGFRVDTPRPLLSSSLPLPVDDDEYQPYSPLVSPMSSSDDLSTHYYSSSIDVSYPPYRHHHHHHHPFDSSISLAPYEVPLPYHDGADLEDLPDAIEDTSDDDSDAPTTPSLGRSSSSLSLDPASSVPSNAASERNSRLGQSTPRVYVDSNDSYFYAFKSLLPFPNDEHQNDSSYNAYHQAC
jgi:hypothetical protein